MGQHYYHDPPASEVLRVRLYPGPATFVFRAGTGTGPTNSRETRWSFSWLVTVAGLAADWPHTRAVTAVTVTAARAVPLFVPRPRIRVVHVTGA